VTAKDKATAKENRITVQGGSGLSKDEVENLVKEAEAHAAEDKAARERVETRNQAEATIYQMEKTLKEHGDKLQGDDRAKLDQAMTAAREAVKSDDLDKIKATQEELKQAAYKLSEAMYAAADANKSPEGGEAPQPGPDATPKAKKGKDDVVDAEFDVD
jgi:molecular chaperone DnaK